MKVTRIVHDTLTDTLSATMKRSWLKISCWIPLFLIGISSVFMMEHAGIILRQGMTSVFSQPVFLIDYVMIMSWTVVILYILTTKHLKLYLKSSILKQAGRILLYIYFPYMILMLLYDILTSYTPSLYFIQEYFTVNWWWSLIIFIISLIFGCLGCVSIGCQIEGSCSLNLNDILKKTYSGWVLVIPSFLVAYICLLGLSILYSFTIAKIPIGLIAIVIIFPVYIIFWLYFYKNLYSNL